MLVYPPATPLCQAGSLPICATSKFTHPPMNTLQGYLSFINSLVSLIPTILTIKLFLALSIHINRCLSLVLTPSSLPFAHHPSSPNIQITTKFLYPSWLLFFHCLLLVFTNPILHPVHPCHTNHSPQTSHFKHV